MDMLQVLEGKVAALLHCAQELKAQNQGLKQENEQLKNDNKKLKSETKQLGEQLHKLTEQNGQLTAKIQKVEIAALRENERLEKTKLAVDTLIKSIDDLVPAQSK
jgi:chromosome segregation ATPase